MIEIVESCVVRESFSEAAKLQHLISVFEFVDWSAESTANSRLPKKVASFVVMFL